jgi:hypothetical protein
MAIAHIYVTDTLEKFRIEFNKLSLDVGDPAILTGFTATNAMGALNELKGLVDDGFTIIDESNNTQTIAGGDTLTFQGTTNQITAGVLPTDILKVGLTDDVVINTSLSVSNVSISNGTITTNDSTSLNINTNLNVTGAITTTTITSTTNTTSLPPNLVFEGATEDGITTTLSVIDPTQNNTVNLPNESGTILTTSSNLSTLSNSVSLSIIDSSGTTVKIIYGTSS